MDDLEDGGISIYPAYFKASVTKGLDYTFEITIINNSASEITLVPEIEKFTQNENTYQNSISLSDEYDEWFILKEISIKSGAQANIPVKFKIPEETNLTKASHYPLIILKQFSKDVVTTANINIEYAIPIYINIADLSNISTKISKFEVNKYVLGENSYIKTELVNDGDTYFAPTSYIEFYKTDLFNEEYSKRIETIPVTKGEPTLLPDIKIDKDITWNRDEFGKYQASLVVINGEDILDKETVEFWIIPGKFIILLISAVVVITMLLLLIRNYLLRKTRKSS